MKDLLELFPQIPWNESVNCARLSFSSLEKTDLNDTRTFRILACFGNDTEREISTQCEVHETVFCSHDRSATSHGA